MHNINSGVMVNMPDDPAQIVRFWHAVEMFSPQQLPRIAARNHVADFRPGDPMPWEPGGKLPQAKSGKIWRHVVFGGVYDLSKIRDVLVKKYGQDDPEAATRGQSALFACTVDAGRQRERHHHIAAGAGPGQRETGEHQRLHRHQAGRHRPPPYHDDTEPEANNKPRLQPGHETPACRATTPSSATTAATPSSRGASSTRIFTTSVSVTASAPHMAVISAGSSASCAQASCGCGRNRPAARTSISQCRAALAHCR